MRYLDLTGQVFNGLIYLRPAKSPELGRLNLKICATMRSSKLATSHQYWHVCCTRCGSRYIVRSNNRKIKRCKCKKRLDNT